MPKPLRLLCVITDSGVGGTEKVLLSLLKNIPRDRVLPVGVVVLKKKREMAAKWEALGIPVIALGLNRWPTLRVFNGLLSNLQREQPDVVHAFLYHAIQLSRLVHAVRPSFKLVTSPRVNYRFAPKMALMLDRWLKNHDAMVLSESEAGRKSLINGQGYDKEKVRVSWTNVDRNIFKLNTPARHRLREEWGISPNELLIGSVGRLHQQKGYDVLIDAVQKMRGIKGEFRVVVAGSGPEQNVLKEKAARLAVPVHFLGERSDVVDVLSSLDIYVQSSRYEGLSNALLEAMSVGLPCVATAVDGTMDFAKDGENLVLARPNDATSLALALGTLIEKPALRATLSENAKIAASTFSLERMIQGFVDAYEHACTVS